MCFFLNYSGSTMTLLIWSHKPIFLELISIFITKLKLKLKKLSPGTNCQRQRYNTAILKDENKRQEYNIITLTNRFQALQKPPRRSKHR